MKLIVGLGNPGTAYSFNRHNIGFLCINHIAKSHGIALDKKQGKARTGKGIIAGIEVLLAKPQTYMNNSGQAVRLLMQKYDLDIDDLIVIHDDIDLPFGKIRIKNSSGAGGHNGIKSIIDCLGTQDFVRIKIGISRPQREGEPAEDTIVDYVLGNFEDEDKPLLKEVIKQAGDAVVCILKEDLVTAMNRFN